MQKTESLRIRITKQILKSSLIELLKERNIHKITVSAICTHAVVNRTTFYKYYGSQYELLEAIENDVCKELGLYLDKCSLATASKVYTAGSAELVADAIPYLTQVFQYISENADICKLLLSRSVDTNFPSRLIASLSHMPQNTKEYLANTHGEANAEFVFDFIMSGCFSFVRKWLFSEQRMSPQKAAHLLTVTLSGNTGVLPNTKLVSA